MRIVTDNYTDVAALVATPDMLTTLPETNLQNAYRERVARWENVDGQRLDLSWDGFKPVSCVCLYRGNFSGTATWRVRAWSDVAMTTTVYDSTTVTICPPTPLGSLEWGVDPLGKHLYTDWDFSVAVAWFDPVLATGITIDVTDPDNADGYVEASRLFVGSYWEPSSGPDGQLQFSWMENTSQARTEGGSLRVEPGARWRRMQVELRLMDEADRRRLSAMLRQKGLREDVFISVFPERDDELERDYMMQANVVAMNPTNTKSGLLSDYSILLEEV